MTVLTPDDVAGGSVFRADETDHTLRILHKRLAR
jgi:hypothetical protein